MAMIHSMSPQNKATSVSSSVLFSVSFSWFRIQILRTFGHDDEYEFITVCAVFKSCFAFLCFSLNIFLLGFLMNFQYGRNGDADVLVEMLRVFPNLNMTTDSFNSTALHTAATQGHIDVVNLLLDTDSELAKIARNNGKTVLHTAARMGHLEVVKSLLGKDPTIGFRTDKKGQSALHMAVKGQNLEIVQELIKPDPSVLLLEDNKGNTPLHIATWKGRIQVAY